MTYRVAALQLVETPCELNVNCPADEAIRVMLFYAYPKSQDAVKAGPTDWKQSTRAERLRSLSLRTYVHYLLYNERTRESWRTKLR